MVFFAFKAVFSSLFNLKYAISCLSLCFLFLFSWTAIGDTDDSPYDDHLSIGDRLVRRCVTMKEEYKKYWPVGCFCDYFNGGGSVDFRRGALNKCESQAKANQARAEAHCNTRCTSHINLTTTGCPEFKSALSGQCAKACQDQDVLKKVSNAFTSDYEVEFEGGFIDYSGTTELYQKWKRR